MQNIPRSVPAQRRDPGRPFSIGWYSLACTPPSAARRHSRRRAVSALAAAELLQQQPAAIGAVVPRMPAPAASAAATAAWFHSSPAWLGFRETGPAGAAARTEFAAAEEGSFCEEEKRAAGLEIAKLGISSKIVDRLAKKGITKLFPIQVTRRETIHTDTEADTKVPQLSVDLVGDDDQKDCIACYGDGCFANGEQDGRRIVHAIHGDRDSSRTTTEVTDGEQDLCKALTDGEEDVGEATEHASAGEVSDDQESCTKDISTCYPCDCVANLRTLQFSSHRDGSIYTGCHHWQKYFCIADRNEASLEEPNNGFENPEALYRPCKMWQVFSIKLVKLPVDGGPVELYGYIAARDHVDSLLNYIVNISRDGPITVDQDSFIPMTGPKRGIDLSETVLIEYDMRIMTGDRKEDDQQLIDGASLLDPLMSYRDPLIRRIHGNNSAVDVTNMYTFCAVNAAVEVIVSEVQSSFALSVSCFTGGLHEEIRLFDDMIIVGSLHVLRRHVIAVTVHGCLDLKLKVGPGSCEEEEHYHSFKVMDDGYASQQIKTEFASFFVKVTWPAATLPLHL